MAADLYAITWSEFCRRHLPEHLVYKIYKFRKMIIVRPAEYNTQLHYISLQLLSCYSNGERQTLSNNVQTIEANTKLLIHDSSLYLDFVNNEK